MEWTDLMSVFGDRLLVWRSRRAEEEADAQLGKGPNPAAGTGAGGHPPPPPPGPSKGTATKSQITLERFKNVCRNHVLHARCRLGDRCPRDHRPLLQADINALWAASRDLHPNEFKEGGGDTPANSQSGTVALCRYVNTRAGCTYGDECQWPHDHSAKEKARAQKVRAARAKEQESATRVAPGAHAMCYDPDSAWYGWPEGLLSPDR